MISTLRAITSIVCFFLILVSLSVPMAPSYRILPDASNEISAPKTYVTYFPESNYPSYSPLEIKKSLYSDSIGNNDYLIGAPITVTVDIKCKEYPLDDILISETFDPDFKLINFSTPYIFDPFQVHDNENISSYLINGNEIISIPRLNSKEWIRYKYRIEPEKVGNYRISTIIRIGRSSIFSDIEVPLDLKIVYPKPEFDVYLISDKSDPIINEALNLEYTIIYKGGAADNCTYNLSPDYDQKYYCYTNMNKKYNLTFKVNKPQTIQESVKFFREGIYTLPGIWIDNKHYGSNQTVVVDTFWHKNEDFISNIITWAIQLLSIVLPLGFLAGKELGMIAHELRLMREKMTPAILNDNIQKSSEEKTHEK